jgi:hypothetical protein
MASNKSIEKAREISRVINDFGFSPSEVAEAMANEHRTLQQSFTSLCLEWLRLCASEDYRYDGRNELSHIVAKELVGDKDIHGLPMI